MFVVRLAGLLLVIALAMLGGAYLLTRDARYLRWLRRLLQAGVVFACVFMALYVAERLMLVL